MRAAYRSGVRGSALALLVLSCQPPVMTTPCNRDGDCPVGQRCDRTRRYCHPAPWRRDSGGLDSSAFDSSARDRRQLDGRFDDRQLLDRAGPSDLPSAADQTAQDAGQADTRPADGPGADRGARDVDGELEGGRPERPVADAPGSDQQVPSDAGSNQPDACACSIAGGCQAAFSTKPGDLCLRCNPTHPDIWSYNNGVVCRGDPCTGAWQCQDGQCTEPYLMYCSFVCDGNLQRCCGAPSEPCCDGAQPCISGSSCTGIFAAPICYSPSCGSEGQVCCGITGCYPGLVCDVGRDACVPCGVNQQFCCNHTQCGAGTVCGASDRCVACGSEGQLCCPDSTCTDGISTCCESSLPRYCMGGCL